MAPLSIDAQRLEASKAWAVLERAAPASRWIANHHPNGGTTYYQLPTGLQQGIPVRWWRRVGNLLEPRSIYDWATAKASVLMMARAAHELYLRRRSAPWVLDG